MENNQLKQAFDAVSIVRLAHELGFAYLKEGAGQRSPFRSDKKAGSFSVQRSYFKDHAHDEHAGGHIAFVELARPGWSKKECVEFIIRTAGMEPERQSAGAVKRIAKEKREAFFIAARAAAFEIPELGRLEPGVWTRFIRELWNDGQAALLEAGKLDELAAGRGWPAGVMRAMIGMNKTSFARLPWSNGEDRKRGWAWLVEKPIFKGSQAGLVPVGYHVRYSAYEQGVLTGRPYVYVPYIPRTQRLSAIQEFLKALKVELPTYPFVLGRIECPRLVVILEGQFDAVSFALAFGWLENGFPLGVVVMGLRGISSQRVFLAAYGAWLRRHKPFVWVFPDNDEAGKALVRRKNDERIDGEPCFVDRIRAQGCRVKCQFLPLDGCKDFNDIWRAHRPSVEQMRALALDAGCGDLIGTREGE